MDEESPTYPLIVIDSSSRKTWVGIKTGPSKLSFSSSNEDSSKSLFDLIRSQLATNNLKLDELQSIAYCEGPGSMLGVRATVMAIRTWQGIGIQAAKNLFTFASLQLGKSLIAKSEFSTTNSLIITDARRNAWNTLPYPGSKEDNIALIENEEIERDDRTLITFSDFVQWTSTTAKLSNIEYAPEIVFEDESFRQFIRRVNIATPLNLRTNDYKKWIPKIHSNTSE